MTGGRPRSARAQLECVYCPSPGDRSEHVPPKQFLNKPYPRKQSLVTVPCCGPCNASLQRDQEYFVAVLAQVSDSPTLQERVADGGSIDRMFRYSPGLEELILRQLTVDEDRVAIEPDLARLNRVALAVAQGLFFARYGGKRDPSEFRLLALGVEEAVLNGGVPPEVFMGLFTERFRAKPWRRVQAGVFEYVFARDSLGKRLLSFARYHGTLLAVVACPEPPSRRSVSKGRLARRHKGTSGPVKGA